MMNTMRQTHTSIRRACGRALLLAAALAAASLARAANYYVDVDWTGTQSGTTNAPYKTIKAAVDAANAVAGAHNIYIAAGWYGDVANAGTEDYSAGGGADGGMLLNQRTSLYGGYAGWDGVGTAPENFNWTEASRVPRSSVIDLKDAASRAFRSTRSANGQISALFDGFVFRNASHAASGGAITHTPSDNNYGRLVINNCFFTNNVTTANGGAVYSGVAFDSQTITSSEFIANQAANGGAFFENGHACPLTFEDCLFRSNTATGQGGAVYIGGSSGEQIKTSRRCRYESNAASTSGGAFSYGNNARAFAERTAFVGNAAPSGAATFGRDWWMGSLTLHNCLVSGNTGGYAILAAGNMDAAASPLIMLQCTVVGNAAGGVRFADTRYGRRATIQNSIIANNGAYGIYRARTADTAPLLDYNNVTNNTSGGYFQCAAGVGSISNDPQFVDAAAGDLRLAKGSPCIDTGTNLGITTDLDGVARPTRYGYDMGCYEEWQIPIIANRAPIVDSTSVTARAFFTYESTGIVTHAWFVLDTTDQGTNSLSGWWQVADSGVQTQGVIFGQAFTGLTPSTTYRYRCVSSNSYDLFWGPVATFTTAAAGGATRLWTGLGGNALASNTNNWQDGLAPGAGDYVLLDASSSNMTWDAGVSGLSDTVSRWTQTENYRGTVTFNTLFGGSGFTNFTVSGDMTVGGGTVTHVANPAGNTAVRRLSVSVGGSLTVGSTAQILADGIGFQAGYGPGKGVDYRHGGGYGGVGGSYFDGNVTRYTPPTGTTYGSIPAPIDLGSGGQAGNSGIGGGAIAFNVTGNLVLDGVMSANGSGWVCGSGGSVYIRANAISGGAGAVIRANGGSSGSNAGSGGGGRVAVVLSGTGADFSGFSGSMTAYGGNTGDGQASGAAGTVYRETLAQGSGQGMLIIDNTNRDCAPGVFTLMPDSVNVSQFAQVIITNKGNLAVGADDTLNFGTANIIGAGPASAFVTITNATGVTFPNPFTLSGYTLKADALANVTGHWRIASNGVLSHTENTTTERYKLNLTIDGSLTVLSNGAINVDGMGYDAGFGPGTSARARHGGSHGGVGGTYVAGGSLTPTGTTYGAISAPTNLGSGAQPGNIAYSWQNGGGAVLLTVTGALTNHGTISANGAGWPLGSGGSIFLTVGSLAGSGTIRANGGDNPGGNAGGGGGGRVAVVLSAGDFTGYSGAITARGGDCSTANEDGAAGTVYRAAPGMTPTVMITNFVGASCVTGVVTPLRNATELKNVTVVVANGARFGVATNAYCGDLTVHSGGLLDLAGKTLTAQSAILAGVRLPGGAHSAASLGSALVIDSAVPATGLLVIRTGGTVILVR